jgi:hypothetical protein
MKPATALLVLTLACTTAPSALADCVDGQRDPTLAEKTFADKLKASLKAALPAAPAPLYLENEPSVSAGIGCGKDAPEGKVNGWARASYTASLHYSDRVTMELKANYAYPDANDIVLGTLPKKPVPFKVQNLVVKVDGYNAQYMSALKQAIDRDRLQALLDQPLPDTPAPAAWTVGKPGAATAKNGASASSTASVVTPPTQPAAANKSDPAPTPPDQTQAVADKAKDAVNKLRGLFGR